MDNHSTSARDIATAHWTIFAIDSVHERLVSSTLSNHVWRLGARRNSAKYAFAVYEGVIREVYRIDAWHSAGSSPYRTRPLSHLRVRGRVEFTGAKASESVRKRYLDHTVEQYWKPGNRNPIVYVKIDRK
jgi:hypothetical protein